MLPQTRQEFSEWCLRQLGKGVITINVSQQQVEDVVDKSVQWIQRVGIYGTHHAYYAHKLTKDDLNNGFFPLPNDVTHTIRAFALSGGLLGSPTYGGGISVPGFGVVMTPGSTWSFATTGSTALGSGYLSYSMQLQQYFSEMQAVSNTRSRPVRFDRYLGRCYIDASPDQFQIGQFVMVECYRAVNEDQSPMQNSFWSDDFLSRYCTASIKKIWAGNLSKFEGLQMPGNIQFNGKDLKAEAIEELKTLDEECFKGRFGSLPNFIVG